MLKSKLFESKSLMNVFIGKHNIKVVSIQTVKKMHDTGLPLPNGKTCIYEKDYFELWYEDK